ncbi:unnamed protein product, partial [Iphiclides podalirius]
MRPSTPSDQSGGHRAFRETGRAPPSLVKTTPQNDHNSYLRTLSEHPQTAHGVSFQSHSIQMSLSFGWPQSRLMKYGAACLPHNGGAADARLLPRRGPVAATPGRG